MSTGVEPSDLELVGRASSGDRDAFAAIYQRYHVVVYRFARMMSGSPTVAADVTQEVFVALLRDLSRYEPRRAGLATYLYGMARNITRGRIRRERRFVDLESAGDVEPATVDDPGEALAGAQEVARLRRVIAALPSRYREVVILCELHGLSYADAAAALGTPVGTVRSRLHRARQLIADRMQALGGRPAPSIAVARCLA